MRLNSNGRTLLLILAVLGVGLAMSCNSATDDPGVSENQITVNSFAPTEACIDVDGELVDIDGDGTKETTVFTSTVQTVTFDSRVRGSGNGSNWSDVIFEEVEIRYNAIRGGGAPLNRKEGISVTVPAGGSADFVVTTVMAADAATFAGDTGHIELIFRGHDAGGEPVSAKGRTAINAVTQCN